MSEYFDLYDDDGRPLGARKERALVHRDGDWHRSIGLWIVRPAGALIFQRRGAMKDTMPGRLTGSVTGHYAAGETLDEVLRESLEEIGLPVRKEDLLPLGLWRHEDVGVPGIIDRELQDVLLWPTATPLTAMRPDPAEVSALVEIAPAQLLRLLAGKVTILHAPCLPAGGTAVAPVRLTLADFVPTHTYHARVAQAALTYAAGGVPTLG